MNSSYYSPENNKLSFSKRCFKKKISTTYFKIFMMIVFFFVFLGIGIASGFLLSRDVKIYSIILIGIAIAFDLILGFVIITLFLVRSVKIIVIKDGEIYSKETKKFFIENYQNTLEEKFYGNIQISSIAKRRFTNYYIFLFHGEIPLGFTKVEDGKITKVLEKVPDAHGREGFAFYNEQEEFVSIKFFN